MQPVPVPFDEYSEDVEEEQPVRSWQPSRRVFAAGAITLALTALAGASFRNGDASGSSVQNLIMLDEMYPLKACIKKSKYGGHKWDCCLASYSYNNEDRSKEEVCCPDPSKCGNDLTCKKSAWAKCNLSSPEFVFNTVKKEEYCIQNQLLDIPVCHSFKEFRGLGNCSAAGENCLFSRCCQDSKRTCYQKNNNWADCRLACQKGEVDKNSPVDLQAPWTCDVIERCSVAGKGCLETGCCKEANNRCYMKTVQWADCKPSCVRGKIDKNSPKETWFPWSCDTKCSKSGDGCMKTGCCEDPEMTCFEKNANWSDCKPACKAGEVDPNSPKNMQSPWTCRVLQMKNWTPTTPAKA